MGQSEPWDFRHQAMVVIENHDSGLIITAKDPSQMPKLMIDGWSAIKIDTSSNIVLSYLEVEGTALSITGEQATANRERLTGRAADGCGQYTDQTTCDDQVDCTYSEDNSYCQGTTWSYFAGKGFDIDDSTNLTIEYNWVHHCTDSGIRCDRCDDVVIRNNLVYGNVWYTHSASSGIVFAESQGTGNLTFEGNVVYANRNYLPFFLTQGLEHFGSGVENYGLWNMNSVVDGSGVYITRNLDFEGTFTLKDNIAFDNGINGLVVHKTTHENV